MVQVELGASGAPTGVTYSRHESGHHCQWSEITTTAAGRPVTYVAQGSHANFAKPGTYESPTPLGPYDTAYGDGEEVATVTAVDISPNTPWLLWPGRWGASGKSVEGPLRQGGQRWIDPLAWSAQLDSCLAPFSGPVAASTATSQKRGRRVPGRPPTPRIRASVSGDTVTVNYRFARFPRGRARRPVVLLTSVDPRGDRYPPLTYNHRIRRRAGTVRRPLGLGEPPFVLRVEAISRAGTRSRTVVKRLRVGR
jgi:hypothetical protein